MNRRISVRAIAIHDGKLLCVRQKSASGASNDYWNTPGGGLDDGEELIAGVQREMMEETGIAAEVGNLLYVQQFMFGDREYLEFFFSILNASDYATIDLAASTHGLLELEEIAFIDPASEAVLPKFLQSVDLTTAADQPTKFYSYL